MTQPASDGVSRIGVVADPAEHAVITEFFELFKTPWEFWQPDGTYDAVLCSGKLPTARIAASLVLVYASADAEDQSLLCEADTEGAVVSGKRASFPIYGSRRVYTNEIPVELVDSQTGASLLRSRGANSGKVIFVGYDLFVEVRHLLTAGQPEQHAAIATLDCHISLLRDLILAEGIALVEIPPIPEGYQFLTCLTHDVDHPLVRRHVFDHTGAGFFYRALVGSFRRFLDGRAPLRELLWSWGAALRLPFVAVGVARDFWATFAHDYRGIEGDLPSTFFFLPFRGRPGRQRAGNAPAFRAAGYDLEDVREQIGLLLSSGCEIGLHGLDAWLSAADAAVETQCIERVQHGVAPGVRMHWLYFDAHSHAALDEAGLAYDSTVGYNGTVGFRAGTGQVYQPLTSKQLLELPLQIMDTALFLPAHLDLTKDEGRQRVRPVLDQAAKNGGCVVINWHDRSLAPERNWGAFYEELIADLKNRGAWFATASQAVAWFRKRRAARFVVTSQTDGSQRVSIESEKDDLPALQLVIYSTAVPRSEPELAAATVGCA